MKRMRMFKGKFGEQSGAVTIFMVIVFFAMILLIGLFIDLARIKAAQNQLRRVVDASARSVLADYDTKLRTDYGLFGNKSKNYNRDFKKYVQVNLSSGRDQNLRLLDYRYENSNIVLWYPLGNPHVLKRQILETMKYKAPIEIIKALINKFIQFRKAALFFDQSNDQRKSLNLIEEKIAKIHQSNQKIKQSKDKLDKANDSLKNVKRDIRSETNSQKLKELADKKSKLEKDMKKLGSDIDEELHKSKRAALELEIEIKKLEDAKPKDIFENHNSIEQNLALEDKPVIENTRQRITTYRTVADNIKVEIDKTRELIHKEASGKEISKNTLSFGLESASKAYEEIKSRSNPTIDPQKQADLKNQSQQLQEQYPELARQFESLQIDTNIINFEKNEGNKADKIAEFLRNTFNLINVSENLIKSRDELFINEYVLTYFSYMTSSPRGAIQYPYRKSEAEYICYGENYIPRVVSELYLTRFALDSAAYFAFTPNSPELVGRTLVSLVMGALQASIDTFKLIALNQTVPLASISPNNPFEEVTLNYKDHLRLFFLLHSGEQAKLQRMIQIVKTRSGEQPENINTLSNGTATVSIKMWFLPLAGFKNLQHGPFGTRIVNGRCYISKDVEFGY